MKRIFWLALLVLVLIWCPNRDGEWRWVWETGAVHVARVALHVAAVLVALAVWEGLGES